MEKRNIGIYLLIQFVWISALLCVRCVQIQDMMIERCSTECIVDELAISETATNYIPIETISSDQRIVDVDVLKKRADDEYEILTKIVEAEAGGEDIIGKMLVANVILNRVNNAAFPDSITEVVFQNSNGVYQFTPVSNGRFFKACASDSTIEAVNRVLKGEDVSGGALYFVSRKHADPERMKWFDDNLHFLFTYGGHEFFN